MALYEKFDSRAWHVETDALRTHVDLHYTADGSEDDLVIRNTVESGTPRTFRGFFRQSYDISHKGGGVWDVTVHYGLVDLESSTWQFSTTGETATRRVSQSTIHRIGNAPDIDGLIEFDGEQVKGVDIVIPHLEWQETHKLPASNFVVSYALLLAQYTGTVNSEQWRGFAAGEVLFRGVTGGQRGDHDIELTYYFSFERNLINAGIGGLTAPTKDGWDYAWVRDKRIEDGANNRIIPQVEGLYVERIYDRVSFADLGIGIEWLVGPQVV